MKPHSPFMVSMFALMEINRMDLSPFLDHNYSGYGRTSDPNCFPHFDRSAWLRDHHPQLLKLNKPGSVRFIPTNYVQHISYGSNVEVIEPDFKTYTLQVAGDRLAQPLMEDLALIERAMFLAFKWAGVKYDCIVCDDHFQSYGVRLTKENQTV